jgi:hypothetical protein
MRNLWQWLKSSLTVKGALTTAVGIACDPNVLAVLPASWARSVAIVGGVCTVLGMRRALPAPPGGTDQEGLQSIRDSVNQALQSLNATATAPVVPIRPADPADYGAIANKNGSAK